MITSNFKMNEFKHSAQICEQIYLNVNHNELKSKITFDWFPRIWVIQHLDLVHEFLHCA